MPIANCCLSPELERPEADHLVRSWSEIAGIDSEHMTVTLVTSSAQGGTPIPATAWLWLPSLWSEDEVDTLQRSLARALAQACGLDATGVQVITSVVPSGRVVENGETLRW